MLKSVILILTRCQFDNRVVFRQRQRIYFIKHIFDQIFQFDSHHEANIPIGHFGSEDIRKLKSIPTCTHV